MPIYLDNAATSFPKPDEVYDAVDHYQRKIGAAAGRGAFDSAVEATRIVEYCRNYAAKLLLAESPERIVFTSNATDSLNLVLHGYLNPGDHVVTSQIEHNSVLRPLRDLQERIGLHVTTVPADSNGVVDPADFVKAVHDKTRLVILLHASNVTGAIQPVEEVCKIAHNVGAKLLVDAAQSAGHIPIYVSRLPVDFLACAGHKGLLGPLGTGLLYIRPGAEHELRSVRQGGTGSQSENDRQPDILPDKFESGNLNVLGLAGLGAALNWVKFEEVERIREGELHVTNLLYDGLSDVRGIRLLGPRDSKARVGALSLTVDGYDPQSVATILDQNYGIQVRAGLHCAPGAHRALGTFFQGGTVRLSVGLFTTPEEIATTVSALKEIAASAL